MNIESYAMGLKTYSINVNTSERVCVSCDWFEQYYRKNRGNVYAWVPTSIGYCLAKQTRKGAMCKGCSGYAPRGGGEK